MFIAVTSVALAIVLFLCAFLGFKTGLRLGMNTAKGIIPNKVRSPVQVIKETVKEVQKIKQEHEEAEENKKFNADIERLMNYTGDIEDEE